MRHSKYPSLGILDALFKIVYGVYLDPSKNGLYESLSPRARPSREYYSKQLYYLERRGYLKRVDQKIIFTKKGEERALLRSLEQMTLQKKRDGKYRLIAFDIPEHRRKARGILRQKMYEFEFKQIQKSLYLTPYACEEEIGEISRILKLQGYLRIFILDSKTLELNFSSHRRSAKE